ncbi:carbamoyltransferase HypF [Streptomyces xiamenensis]
MAGAGERARAAGDGARERAQSWRIEVSGTVQGVGFRPFVYRTATALGLAGWVRNVDGRVVMGVSGRRASLAELVARCRGDAPPLAAVGDVTVGPLIPGDPPAGPGFTVLTSIGRGAAGSRREVPVDAAPCRECLTELSDPGDRRHRYPFINCTACGPRATVITDLPYDRERTTMRPFTLCPECAAEYANPADRRFHAEPLACPECGPRLSWRPGTGRITASGEGALAAAVDALTSGGLIAVKGVGGYQLLCDASQTGAVARLRERKRRPDKPFAVLVRDLAMAQRLASPGPRERAELSSPARPIVLLPARGPVSGLAPGVHPGTGLLGLMLPAGPLHHLLAHDADRPLVCTSGNLSDEPIVTDDAEAVRRLSTVADGILSHDRDIRARSDDSVVFVSGGRRHTVRRARGYAPAPRRLPIASPRPLVAAGAQLKNTFTLVSGDLAVTGAHVGDLRDPRTADAFEEGLRELSRLSAITPEVVAHDLHPGYTSTQWATARRPAGRRVPVQHHHAHVAACAAEHQLTGPFTGVALDGLGLGDDGTLWGGEILVADLRRYRRVGRFGRAPLPGGEAAVRSPFRMALGYLLAAEELGSPAPEPALLRALADRGRPDEVESVRQLLARGVNCPVASSAGRLFDAAAAVLGLADTISYEAQAAVALETAAGALRTTALPWRLSRGTDGIPVYDPLPTLTALLRESHAGTPVPALAAGFHTAVAEATAALVWRAIEDGAPDVVCLSGGCFQNRRLLEAVSDLLTEGGARVLTCGELPANDGGISFGQAAVAAARLATEEQE